MQRLAPPALIRFARFGCLIVIIYLYQKPQWPTVIVLGVSAVLNVLLFSASLIDWKLQNNTEDSTIASSDNEKNANPVFIPTTIVISPSSSPVPVRLYSSDQVSKSYDDLSDIDIN